MQLAHDVFIAPKQASIQETHIICRMHPRRVRSACVPAGRVGNFPSHGYPPPSIGFSDVLGFSEFFVAFATSLSTTSSTLLCWLPNMPIAVVHPSRHSPLFPWLVCLRSGVLRGWHNVAVPRLLDVLDYAVYYFAACTAKNIPHSVQGSRPRRMGALMYVQVIFYALCY